MYKRFPPTMALKLKWYETRIVNGGRPLYEMYLQKKPDHQCSRRENNALTSEREAKLKQCVIMSCSCRSKEQEGWEMDAYIKGN